MADKVAKRANRKIYGLVYSRGTTGRFKPYEIAKDDDLIIGSLPKEIMRKVSRRSNSIRYRAKESLLGHCIDNDKGKEGTEMITMKGKSKAEYSKLKESQTGEEVPIGNGQIEVDTVQEEDNKNVNTPMNRKRGADGEIVCAYLLSPQKSVSRLRPRKEVPAFRMVNLEENDNEFVVGKRVKVYWSGSRRWFTGCIIAFDKKNRLHRILYEDGDKEALDLRKERFELEVMPTDNFKLKSKPYSARKADGLDTGNVREAVMKEYSRNVSGAKTMTKSSESKLKREAKKEGKRTSSKAWRKDTEVIMEDLASNVDVIPTKVGEVVNNKVSDKEEPGEASPEEDESNFFSEAPKEGSTEFKAEAAVVKSHSEFWSMVSDNSSIKESGKAVEDDFLKISIAELAKEPKGSRKRLMPKAKRIRTNRTFSREFGKDVGTLEAHMKSHVRYDELKTTQIDVDINSEAIDVSQQNISRKNEALEKKESEGDETLNESPFTALDLTSKKIATGSGNISRKAANEVENLTKTENKASEHVTTCLRINPQNVKVEREVLAAQIEFVTSIKKGEEEVITGITNVQRPGDVRTLNTNHGAESILEAESMKPCEASSYLLPIRQISPEEAKPNVFQGKVKLENGESDKESKEGMDCISEKSEIYGSKEGPKQ
ncbi:uncharacterized protein LOC111285358 [Durio zibethinus]|uniref:Uncharacterized protein LOC111285358 n=1 Tax=Durio zibethinus TaxID=66656 RepID=A0A6P5XQN2_DURZI|nr:uncharacterized protein LOC111285358 [Durio zibethinus]